MNNLEIIEGKKLKLVHVFCKEFDDLSLEESDMEVQKFLNFLEVSRIQTRGPLIVHHVGSQLLENGNIQLQQRFMIQLIRPHDGHSGYLYYPEISVPNCLYLRFEGREEHIHLAYQKIEIHMYEKNLTPVGGLYQIQLEEQEDIIILDIFQQVEELL